MSTSTEIQKQEAAFFSVDLEGMQQGVREAQGLTFDDKYIRQKDHLKDFGKIFCFKVLPPTMASVKFYNERKTFPFATVPHGWFVHPTKTTPDGSGGQKSHRFFHISPKAIGEPDRVENWLNDTVKPLTGYAGAPEEHVEEIVTIFRSLYTSKNPEYRHLGGPNPKLIKKLIPQIKEEFPGYTYEQYEEMAQRVRFVWSIWDTKYLMPIVQVSDELNENGESVPLTNQAQILDFQGVIKNALFHPQSGLIARNAGLQSRGIAESKGQPFQAYKQFISHSNAPTYDLFIECFENRQFVGNNPNKKGYADYNAWFRRTPTKLENGDSFFIEENRIDLIGEVKRGIRNEKMVIDCFKTHFGMTTPEEFDKEHSTEETSEPKAQSAASQAEEIANEVANQVQAEETKEDSKDKEKDFKINQLKASIEGLESLGVDVPEQLLAQWEKLTGESWRDSDEPEDQKDDSNEVEEEVLNETEPETKKEEKPKPVTKTKKVTPRAKV